MNYYWYNSIKGEGYDLNIEKNIGFIKNLLEI